ncbi:hypothetical protein [Xanthocytophaga flava]|uniref:hypothetical protein n=1 Tax=Xanthocytophaga flava TaxID=3048013 RepID=UPI0028D6B16F|nr:hypothetical protein [Xanthocytophaga flavus]MDJ1470169.1 hypothetical protein [Xanthocytophaga flavus]
MDKIKITWTQTCYSKINYKTDYYFYAFSRGNQLLYLGYSKKQHVKDEIKQNINRVLKKNTRGISIWLGEITDTSFGRLSKQIILDTEALLIYKNQPLYNKLLKKSYNGRENLKILSINMPYMFKQASFSSNKWRYQ